MFKTKEKEWEWEGKIKRNVIKKVNFRKGNTRRRKKKIKRKCN